jgi:hypothetical protein
MVFNATFQLYRLVQFYWWRNPGCPVKTTDLSQVTDQLYHIMLHKFISTCAGFELKTLVVIGTGCIDSCKIKLPYDDDHDDPLV